MALLVAALVGIALAAPSPAMAEFPEKPIKLVVPFAPGGRSDTTARLLQKVIEKNHLLAQPIVVVNVPGAGGTIGGRQVKDAEPDGYTIGIWHLGLLTTAAMEVADYGPDAFDIVAEVGTTAPVYAVPEASPYANLEEFLQAARDNPDTIRDASNIGAPVHFVSLLLMEEAGGQLRYIQTGGGSNRLKALLGDHADSSIFDTSEYARFKDSGIRALVTFWPERNAQIPDVPTARELGYDVVFESPNWIFAPKGTPEEVMGVLATAIDQARQDPEIVEAFENQGVLNNFKSGAEVEAELPAMFEQLKAVASKIGKDS
ncbi:MAG: tripartite tricarboxylate transporter substrate binding protein [Geminicoccaceae bacterium]